MNTEQGTVPGEDEADDYHYQNKEGKAQVEETSCIRTKVRESTIHRKL